MMIVPHLTLPLSHWSSEDLLSGVTSMTLHCYCTEESMTTLIQIINTLCVRQGFLLFTVRLDVWMKSK